MYLHKIVGVFVRKFSPHNCELKVEGHTFFQKPPIMICRCWNQWWGIWILHKTFFSKSLTICFDTNGLISLCLPAISVSVIRNGESLIQSDTLSHSHNLLPESDGTHNNERRRLPSRRIGIARRRIGKWNHATPDQQVESHDAGSASGITRRRRGRQRTRRDCRHLAINSK